MIRLSLCAACLCLTSLSGTAQHRSLQAFGGAPDEERAVSRVVYYDSASQSFEGQFAISYGRPLWNSIYEDSGQLDDLTMGKTFRLGKNFWSTLDTTIALEVGGVRVPPGLHYLGLRRSENGQWRLGFIDPSKARRSHLDASRTASAEFEFTAPLAFSPSEIRKERLMISLSYDPIRPEDVRMRIEWGPHMLSAPIKAILGE